MKLRDTNAGRYCEGLGWGATKAGHNNSERTVGGGFPADHFNSGKGFA